MESDFVLRKDQAMIEQVPGWHEYHVGVCVNTEGMHKIGTLVFCAKDVNSASAVVKNYLVRHPLLTFDLREVTVQSVENETQSHFVPIEQTKHATQDNALPVNGGRSNLMRLLLHQARLLSS